MKVRITKFLALLMALVTLLGTLSMPALFAAEEDTEATSDSSVLGAPEMTVLSAEDGAQTGEALPEDEYHIEYDKKQLDKLIGVESYYSYTQKHKDMPKGEDTIVINAVESYLPDQSTANVEVVDGAGYGDGSVSGDVLRTGDTGETVFKINVPKEGKYAVALNYASVVVNDEDATEISTTIERMFSIDGAMPFSECRYLYFPRCWEYEYYAIPTATEIKAKGIDISGYEVNDNDMITNGDDALLEALGFDIDDYKLDNEGNLIDREYDCKTFPKDKNGNDTRPRRWEVPMWQTYYLRDWLGYEIDPFQYYFSEGEHIVSLVSNREEMILKEIILYRYDEEPLYEDWLKEMHKKGVKEVTGVEPIKVQAENPDTISVQNVIPGNDRTSSITEPQHPAYIKYNILENGTANNWMKYKVTVPKTGLYSLSFRFRQNSLIGMFTSRRVKINGDIQFREASYLRFMYETSFQSTFATDGDQEFLFYFEEGENEVEIEIVLGEMVEYVYRIEQLIDELNVVYQKMLMITGPIPDSNRDYGFYRLVPDCIKTIANAANELYDIQESIVEMTGEEGDQTNNLEMIAELFETMATDEYEIAPNFLTFKNYIISLSNWLYAALGQPLKLDYFIIGAADEEVPPDVATTWETIWFECRAFVASFTMDYTTIGFAEDETTKDEEKETHEIEMWAISDRESMLINRYIVDNYFSADGCVGEGINIRIKVITAGLTEAILAGIGPDLAFLDTINTITFGMRKALLPLEGYEGFEDVMKEYPEAMMTKLTMTGQDNIMHTYGLPTTMILPLAFYRLDTLSELGIEPPETWDELLTEMPALLNNNMDVGLPTGLVGTTLFLYQTDGGDLYRDNGFETALDDPVALSAFKTLCEMFQKYSCPVAYDITRFRTGEIPIMIQEDGITIYNQLMTFYELRGLWAMGPVIGTAYEDGTIDRTAITNTQAMVIPRGGYDPEIVWKYVSWYCGTDSQTRQAREAIAVSAPTNKFSTANKTALLAQKWTDEERRAVAAAIEQLEAVPEYPGNYIFAQYVQFAFLDAYNKGANPADAMLGQVSYINKEISRKRKEFGLDYYEISYDENGENKTVVSPK